MRPPARQHPLPGSVPSSPGTLHPGGQPPTQQQQQGAGLRLWIAPSPDGQHWVRGGGGGGTHRPGSQVLKFLFRLSAVEQGRDLGHGLLCASVSRKVPSLLVAPHVLSLVWP